MGRKKDATKTGSGKRKSLKGTFQGKWSNQPKLEKRRPGQARQVSQGANITPLSDDEGIARIPKLQKQAFQPMVEPDAPQPFNLPKTAGQLRKEKKQKKRQRAKEKRAAEPATEAPKDGDEDQEKPDKPDLPKQRPGENKFAYFARLDKAVSEKLRETRKKVTTDKMRAKKRAVRVKKKAPKDKRRADKKTDASDGLFVAGERAAYGDVAERPPALSQAALRSRSKLKKARLARPEPSRIASSGIMVGEARNVAVPKVTSLREPVKNQRGGAEDLADYAAKVRAAYADMKKQRLNSHSRK